MINFIFYSIFITQLIFFQNNAYSFVYRFFSDPKELCLKAHSDREKKCEDIKNYLPLYNNPQVENIMNELDKALLSDYKDILAADNKSSQIIKEALDQIENFKKLKDDLRSITPIKENKEFDRINQNAQLLASLEYKIKINNKKSPKCFTTRDKICAEKEKIFYENHIKKLVEQKAKLLFQNPILTQRDAQDFINNAVSTRIKYHQKEYSKNHSCMQNVILGFQKNKKCKSRSSLNKRRDLDLKFNFSDNDLRQYLGKSIKAALKSTEDLKRRHQHLRAKIKSKLYKNKKRQMPLSFRVKGLYKTIFHDRNLTTDYYTTLSPDEFGNENSGDNKFNCKIIKENETNDKNSEFNSYALDAATLLIPLGGPFLIGKTLSKFSKLTKLSKIENIKNKGVLYTELTAMGLDTENLSNQQKHCMELNEKFILSKEIPDHLKEKHKECLETLNDMTMSYTIAMLGGALGTLPVAKKLLKKLPKSKSLTLRKSATGNSSKGLISNKSIADRRNYDPGSREFLNNLSDELGDYKTKLLTKYNHGNLYDLDSRDQIYIAGLADIFEKELKHKGLSLGDIERTVSKKIDEILKSCKKVKK